ncbi:hypothetical protein Poli38472_011366 [Pythium oligandrum]|uniref:YrhK domain-containing protein n=1 Tax=Pythium oligandrum TaxID=41045 RepID=A0A8K1FJ32_PYTOL|nr:hypothetical protein Poli38472_011366 [Pythium oligandrum]|eukprot:TMW64486.1 hypothetical protein Poli38472_011366 [Pythium oligandrum]
MPGSQYSPEYNNHASPAILGTKVVHGITFAEKVFQITKVLAYFCGSVLFLFGSVLFLPKYATLWDGQGAVVGSWVFFFGCICFMIGTNADFIDLIRYSNGTTTRRIVDAYIGLLYVAAGGIFQLGALYFLPDYYVTAPSLGCWSFLIGSIMFCMASLWDVVNITITHDDPKKSGVQLSNLYCWGTLVAIGCFAGAMCFIIGSWFYLPKFIAVEDADYALHYMNKAITSYIVGSVFFVINALAQIPGLQAKLSQKASLPK